MFTLTDSSCLKLHLEAGWLGRQAILMTGINSIVYILSTLPPCVLCSHVDVNVNLRSRWYLVDRWGRRPILLSGAVVVSLPAIVHKVF